MRLTDKSMYARVLASDASYNGQFFFGVITTGIYCLPSCKAKKPKEENIRFFPTCEAARAAGLRACRKCHPDDFARGADPVLESIEDLVGEIRATPTAFPDVASIVRRSGFGATRLFELFRQHYHATPADILLRARFEAARQALLKNDASLTEVAAQSGFESLSVFHDHFRRFTGLTPATYRELSGRDRFTLKLPENYPLNYLRRALSRDAQSVTERFESDRYISSLRLGDGNTALIKLDLSPETIQVTLTSTASNATVEIHGIVASLLGLSQDALSFSRLAKKLGLTRLVKNRDELRIIQTSSVYDGILWSVIGQQINLPFARLLRRRLIELAGTPIGENLFALPSPATVAALSPAELLPLQFSRQKADYVIATSRLIAEGKLDLHALPQMSATRAERTLLAMRGLGPWSVNYVMMRSLGFADCVPYGDTGVTSGLQSLLKLDTRPDVDATRRLMAVFSPYRSLATAHLWQLNQPIP
jgi:AraC family transcriptional regulator, regulatory protein of adaptative response / DNA-3-methyladenine glycosylase II